MVKSKIIGGLAFMLLFLSSLISTGKEDRKATYYHDKFVDRLTSTGEVFCQKRYTAAHNTMPLNSFVKVVNEENNRFIIVKINDRCPRKGVIDLSLIAAKRINMIKQGVTNVSVEILREDCQEVWEKQDEIFYFFDRSKQVDSLWRARFAQLLEISKAGLPHKYLFATNIRVIRTSNRDEAIRTLKELNKEYERNLSANRERKTNMYNIYIGPYFTREIAEIEVEKLRKKGLRPRLF